MKTKEGNFNDPLMLRVGIVVDALISTWVVECLQREQEEI